MPRNSERAARAACGLGGAQQQGFALQEFRSRTFWPQMGYEPQAPS